MATQTGLARRLTTREVAALSRRTEKCIRNRVYAGKVPQPCSRDGRLLFDRDAVLAWIGGEVPTDE